VIHRAQFQAGTMMLTSGSTVLSNGPVEQAQHGRSASQDRVRAHYEITVQSRLRVVGEVLWWRPMHPVNSWTRYFGSKASHSLGFPARYSASDLRSAVFGSTESVEVDRIPELQTECDPVLIDIGLHRRRSPSTLEEERVSSIDADKACNLIGRRETQ
jgi:hypothetical protein